MNERTKIKSYGRELLLKLKISSITKPVGLADADCILEKPTQSHFADLNKGLKRFRDGWFIRFNSDGTTRRNPQTVARLKRKVKELERHIEDIQEDTRLMVSELASRFVSWKQ